MLVDGIIKAEFYLIKYREIYIINVSTVQIFLSYALKATQRLNRINRI